MKQAELTDELRRARNWILGVGILMVIVDQIIFAVMVPSYAPEDLVREARNTLFLIDGLVLAFFVGMYILAKHKPVMGCTLALLGFWAVQLYAAAQPGGSITQGILIKILFTMALVKGIKSASRAEQLQSELGKVFE
jgi:hypothetical protein